jgi:hypothetical protein
LRIIISAFSRVRAGKTALAIFFTLTFAAVAWAMKSDPDNYYLDPEEIRPIIRESLAHNISFSSSWQNHFEHIEEFDVRLLKNHIDLFDIEGGVVAYIYIAYFPAGPLPTLEEISEAANGTYDDRIRFYEKRTHGSFRDFCSEYFSYELDCAYALIGTNGKDFSGMESTGVPTYIMGLKGAEKAAKKYFGRRKVKFLRYILCPKFAGYEFSDGKETIFVPFNIGSGGVYSEMIITRKEIEANINDYRFNSNAERARKWADKWKRRLAEHGIE